MTIQINGVIDEWDDTLCCTFGDVRASAAFGPAALRIEAADGALLTHEQARALATWLVDVSNADELRRVRLYKRSNTSRWRRLAAWALRIRSPSRGGAILTLREAWTGELRDWLTEATRDGFDHGLKKASLWRSGR